MLPRPCSLCVLLPINACAASVTPVPNHHAEPACYLKAHLHLQVLSLPQLCSSRRCLLLCPVRCILRLLLPVGAVRLQLLESFHVIIQRSIALLLGLLQGHHLLLQLAYLHMRDGKDRMQAVPRTAPCACLSVPGRAGAASATQQRTHTRSSSHKTSSSDDGVPAGLCK